MKNTLKIDVDLSLYVSVDILKDSRAAGEIATTVNNILESKGQKARVSSIVKASRNAISLLLSKKKKAIPKFLSVYLPMNVIESLCDTVVPNVPCNQGVVETSIGEDENSTSNDSNNSFSSFSHRQCISFSFLKNVLKVYATFEYLFDYFKHHLSVNSKPMNIQKILTDICNFIFLELRFSVNIRVLKSEISLQISHFVQSARKSAAGKSVIGILSKTDVFSLVFKSIIPLKKIQSTREFTQYRNSGDNLSPTLLIRKNNDQTDVFQFYPVLDTVEITFNETLVSKTLSSFDLRGALNIDELRFIIKECALICNLNLDIPNVEETLKTAILFDRTSDNSSSYFLTFALKCVSATEISKDYDQIPINDSHPFSAEEIDSIIGRTYSTRVSSALMKKIRFQLNRIRICIDKRKR